MQSAVDQAFRKHKMTSTTLGRNSYVAGLACISAHLVESGAVRFVSGLRSVAHRTDLSGPIAAQEEEVEQWTEKLFLRIPLSERAALMTSGKLDRSKFPHRELSDVAKTEQSAHKSSRGALSIIGEKGCRKFIEAAGCTRYIIVCGVTHSDLVTELAALGKETILSASQGKPLSTGLSFAGSKVLLTAGAIAEIEAQSSFRFAIKTAQEGTGSANGFRRPTKVCATRWSLVRT